jgi:DNA-binding FadR family transcriptional regulator
VSAECPACRALPEGASTLIASLAYRLGGATVLARAAELPLLADALLGLQGVLSDLHLHMRPSDGRAILHALRGFEAIFADLAVSEFDHAGLEDLRGALAAAQAAARRIADLLERPPLFAEAGR